MGQDSAVLGARLPGDTSEDKRPRAQHCGLAAGGALQDCEDEPGGRLQPGCEATAGQARVCAPTAELRLDR